MNLPLLGADDIEALGPTGAVDALESALSGVWIRRRHPPGTISPCRAGSC